MSACKTLQTFISTLKSTPGNSLWAWEFHPLRLPLLRLPLLRLPLLRFLDSIFPGISLWAWEFHPLRLRFCLSQTL